MEKTCKCCGKELKIAFPATKYCTKCVIYHKNLLTELRYYKQQMIIFKSRWLYETENNNSKKKV